MKSNTRSEGFEQALLDTFPASTVVLDCDGVIRYANKAWRNFALDNGGDPSKSSVGINYLALCDAAAGQNSDDAKLMAAGIRSVLAGMQSELVINYPCHAPTQARWFVGRLSRIDHNGEIWLAVLHEDVSAQRHMEQQLITALYAAKAANLAKSSFLSTMSHEIRTPLSAISGMAKLIGREPLSPHQTDKLRKLEVAAQHLTSTIDAILDLSKIEANMLELEQLPVQFAQIFDEVESIVQVSLVAKGLRMQMTLDRIPTNLLGDPTRLRQALLNYVGNAIKFTSHGLIRVHASVVEETSESALLRIEVRDSGIGIAAPAIATLFEPFVQAESTTSRNYGGSGLGLSITKRLAQAMGGDVGVHSEVGKSSTFWLTARLKKHTLPAAEVGAAPTRDAALILKREFAGNRVLLVEDDEFNREIGCILLQDVGMQVEEAENGLAALEMALRTRYDLILMDIQMPHMDGLEATRKIRGADPRSMVPIVALSANVFMEDKVRCRDAGMNDFLTKPVEPLVLYSAMLDIFRRQIA